MKLSPEHIPTSQLFRSVLNTAPIDRVTLEWLIRRFHRRAFGMGMLLLGLLALVPGVSVFAAFLLVALGVQMTMAFAAPILPRFIALRSFPTHRIARLIDRSIPVIRALEKYIRPRWQTPFMATQRFVGFIILMLAVTLFMPIPLSNVIPGGLIMLIAVAYLEEDGILLCIALSASLSSLAITFVEVWAAMRGANFLFRL